MTVYQWRRREALFAVALSLSRRSRIRLRHIVGTPQSQRLDDLRQRTTVDTNTHNLAVHCLWITDVTIRDTMTHDIAVSFGHGLREFLYIPDAISCAHYHPSLTDSLPTTGNSSR